MRDSKQILGAAMLGSKATRSCTRCSTSMAAERPTPRSSARVHIHPTVSELIPTLLGSLKPLD